MKSILLTNGGKAVTVNQSHPHTDSGFYWFSRLQAFNIKLKYERAEGDGLTAT